VVGLFDLEEGRTPVLTCLALSARVGFDPCGFFLSTPSFGPFALSLFLGLVGVPDTVLLLEIFCTWPSSDIVSSFGRGRRACDMANGPACLSSQGVATPAIMMLDNTVTGRMFSLIFSRFVSMPKTILWTLLYTLRHVLK